MGPSIYYVITEGGNIQVNLSVFVSIYLSADLYQASDLLKSYNLLEWFYSLPGSYHWVSLANNDNSMKVRLSQRGGVQLSSVVKPDPIGNKECGRDGCDSCVEGGRLTNALLGHTKIVIFLYALIVLFICTLLVHGNSTIKQSYFYIPSWFMEIALFLMTLLVYVNSIIFVIIYFKELYENLYVPCWYMEIVQLNSSICIYPFGILKQHYF